MEGYPGTVGGDSTKQQERHYYLLSELQALVKDLPRYHYFRFGKAVFRFMNVALCIHCCDWLALSSNVCLTTP